MKRLSLSFLSFVAMASLIFTEALSTESNSELPKMSSIEQQQQITLQKNAVVQEEVIKNNLEDVYAGVYIDENAELNVNLVSSVEKLQLAVAQDGIHYHQVKHSLKELEETITKLTDRMSKFNIIQLSLDEKKNKVIVSVENLDERKINRIDKLINPETVEYVNATGEVHVTANIIKAALSANAL